ncbi:MAG TPA: hypothetical protein VJB05_03145 [archaeon]|nr:hypothetical protein [archaeon]
MPERHPFVEKLLEYATRKGSITINDGESYTGMSPLYVRFALRELERDGNLERCGSCYNVVKFGNSSFTGVEAIIPTYKKETHDQKVPSGRTIENTIAYIMTSRKGRPVKRQELIDNGIITEPEIAYMVEELYLRENRACVDLTPEVMERVEHRRPLSDPWQCRRAMHVH